MRSGDVLGDLLGRPGDGLKCYGDNWFCGHSVTKLKSLHASKCW
jgi:hypothetical protein